MGFGLWLVQTLVPMNENVKRATIGVVLLLVCLWLLRTFVPSLSSVRLGR